MSTVQFHKATRDESSASLTAALTWDELLSLLMTQASTSALERPGENASAASLSVGVAKPRRR